MFFAVVHLGPNGTEILYLSTDGIAAAREVNTLCDRKLKSIPLEKIINTYALLYEFPRERVVTCVNCKESYFVSELRPVPVCWDDDKPIGWQYLCPDCVSDLEQNGILTRCECCGEVFYALDLQTNPETGEKELCPHCREV